MLEKIIVGVSCIPAILGLTGCNSDFSNNFLNKYDIKANVTTGTFDTQGKTSDSRTHKVMIGVGLSISDKQEEFKKQGSFKYRTQAEPPDRDLRSVHDLKKVSGEISHPVKLSERTFYPSVGISYGNFRRFNSSSNTWGDLNHATIDFGIGTDIGNINFKAVASHLFWVDTDIGPNPKGKLGYELSAEIPISEKFSLEPFYEQASFENSTNGFKLQVYGIGLVYKIE